MAYHAPTRLQDALSLAAQADQQIVAGGTDVYPAMQKGQGPTHVLDVTRVEGFDQISEGDDGWRIGAAVTWTDVVRADLPPAFDALKMAAREVGSVQIQNAGTVAGNLCNASPAADGVPPLLVLNTEVEVASAARGARRMPLAEFLQGVRATALAPDELVTALHIPKVPEGAVSHFEKLGSRRYLVISITMTAAMIVLDGAGRIVEARVAVGAASPVAQRLAGLEQDCIGCLPSDVNVTSAHLAALSPIEDVRGSPTYRLEAVAEQCRRAIGRAGA